MLLSNNLSFKLLYFYLSNHKFRKLNKFWYEFVRSLCFFTSVFFFLLLITANAQAKNVLGSYIRISYVAFVWESEKIPGQHTGSGEDACAAMLERKGEWSAYPSTLTTDIYVIVKDVSSIEYIQDEEPKSLPGGYEDEIYEGTCLVTVTETITYPSGVVSTKKTYYSHRSGRVLTTFWIEEQCACNESKGIDDTCSEMTPISQSDFENNVIYTYPEPNHQDDPKTLPNGTENYRCFVKAADHDFDIDNSCEKPLTENDASAGNPINCATGEKIQIDTDYLGNGLDPVSFTRQYSSNSANESQPQWTVAYRSPTLSKKTFADGAILYTFTNGGQSIIALSSEDDDSLESPKLFAAQRHFFQAAGASGFQTSPNHDPIAMTVEGEQIQYKNKIFNFSSENEQATISDQSKPDVVRYTYRYVTINGRQLLSRVENRFGRYLEYSYDDNGRLQSLIDQDGYTLQYVYDDNNNLIKVIYPDATEDDLTDNPSREYVFENTDFPNHLTGIVDQQGNRFATFSYNDSGKAISTEHYDGAEKVEVSYPEDGKAIVKFYRDVASNAYRQEEYSYGKYRGRYQLTAKTITACDNCALTTETWEYNDQQLLARHTDPAGVITEWVYDDDSRKIQETIAVGTNEEQVISYTWNDAHNVIETITTANEVTTYSFDERGNRTASTVMLLNTN